MSPNINEMKEHRYLTKEDVDPPVKITIARCEKQDVSMESEPADERWTLYFKEDYLPMVLNWTNISRIALVTEEENSDNWAGKTIVLFNDKSVMYKGKLTGGIRVQVQAEPVAPDVVDNMPITDHGNIPF